VKKSTAVILSNGWIENSHAKTTHGILLGSERFTILGLIDPVYAGKNTADLLNGRLLDVSIYANIAECLERLPAKPQYCIVGISSRGGKLPEGVRGEIIQAIRNGLPVICGLHSFLNDDPEFRREAEKAQVELIDIRKPRPTAELKFWTGEIYSVKTPRIALLGMDCAIGKRTTGALLLELCRKNGIKTEMIYTGQTGWMQGFKHGFIFDATVNDFISGEIERVIIECERESSPDLMLIEGQSGLRNPSGPCGSEFLKSGNVKGVILQHAPGRKYFDGVDYMQGILPPVEDEIELIRFYGARTLAVTLKEEGWNDAKMKAYQDELAKKLNIPVIRPLKENMDTLLPVIRDFIAQSRYNLEKNP
jgi:uncharacterized NAD-dependent epimerase/dehydratase family protein